MKLYFRHKIFLILKKYVPFCMKNNYNYYNVHILFTITYMEFS